MLTVDLKSLISRLNPHCSGALEGAAGLCVARGHYEVTVEHLLARLLDEPGGDLPLILRAFEVDAAAVKGGIIRVLDELPAGNSGKPVFSPPLLEWLQEGWLIASLDLGQEQVRSGALLLALLARPLQLTAGRYMDLLMPVGRETLLARFGTATQGSAEQAADIRPTAGDEAPRGTTSLDRFCTDFTRQATDGKIDPVFGRDREIGQMIDILARRRKNNPIIVGEAGVGKTAVAEGLALRIVEGDVPEALREVRLLGLDLGLLQAGAGVKGEFENRLKGVIEEVKGSPRPIILFIDEAHTIIGAGGQAGGGDAANLLKPALARGELRTIAATTWSEYKKYFEKDAALARRFQPVKLDEPDVETAVLILRGLKEKYEAAHGVTVRDDGIRAAAELSSRYLSGRQLPDKAVDLLDTAAARVKLLLTGKPGSVEEKERRIQALEREKAAIARDRLHGRAVDEERLAILTDELAVLREELAAVTERWHREQELAAEVVTLRKELAADNSEELQQQVAEASARLAVFQGDAPLVRIEVDPEVVARVVADWTGIPLGSLQKDRATGVLSLEEDLRRRIKGQEPALSAVAEVLRSSAAGLKDPRQPLGVFLLVGPSGVGKTETALAVADLLFGGERFLTVINMSEFQERHTTSRLIGSPPGYVGYGEGGVLTEAVRRQPYSVVLLDEVEKAHPDVMNLFYQVFDKGMLADGEGRVIDFANTVIFLTSNLASEVITSLCSEDQAPTAEELTAAIRPHLSRHFKPALLARMSVVPYLTLAPEYLEEIVTLKLGRVADRLRENSRRSLTWTPAVTARIAARCTEVESGARTIDHILRSSLLPLLSREILTRLGSGDTAEAIRLDAPDGGAFAVSIEPTEA
ncbi:type VI secretion system ATPase TssH [Geobacter hydrogenophilus]|uniref:ClpV1 family T6SS ATPase n=1 Tax=Geobacter hydrogenophilus TaxID=40983 RepID=A0A9W6FZU9_9BACT|nr:type VI secretion system ATPase TssH [Geobacter hydrogenophilus]MBT0893497.1 type VI secretion system ATPase TssH [Geobacter hydrogenophilus]GLI37808.1 ClpV1 family T6SS ATPase [Geobacter hydrogenophilus]